MNEKDKKNLIIISGVFIFVMVFMVFFTFYRRDALLSDRTIPKINTDELILGDTGTCTCESGTLIGNECYSNSVSSFEITGIQCADDYEGYWINGKCYTTVEPAHQEGGKTCPSGTTQSGDNCYSGVVTKMDIPNNVCTTEGGYWINSKCYMNRVVATKTQTGTERTCDSCNGGAASSNYCYTNPVTYFNHETCDQEGGYYYNGTCYATRKDRNCSDTPVYTWSCPSNTTQSGSYCYSNAANQITVTESRCRTNNWHWINGKCYKSSSAATDGQVYVCNSGVLSGDKCYSNEITGRASESNCNSIGGSWINSTCYKNKCTMTVGWLCSKGHYNHPDDIYCTICGEPKEPGTDASPTPRYNCGGDGKAVCLEGCTVTSTSCNEENYTCSNFLSANSGYKFYGGTTPVVKTVTCNKSVDSEDGKCKIVSVTTQSHGVSTAGDGFDDKNSYYTVNVIVTSQCAGKTLNLEATNAEVKNPTRTIGSEASYKFDVYPSGCVEKSQAKANIPNCGSDSCTKTANVTLSIWTDWKGPEIGCWGLDSSPVGFKAADEKNARVYYWNQAVCTYSNGVVALGYTERWTRGGCGGGSSGSSGTVPTPTYACYANASELINATKTTWATGSSQAYPYLIAGKTETECKAYACFVNSDGSDYKWANTTPSGYTKVPDILSQSKCKPETPACYIDKNGNYDWGKHKNDSNYTLVPSVNKDTDCKAGTCYTNGEEYVWSQTSPGEGYNEVNLSSTECRKKEEACYLHEGKYIWGDYGTKAGYIFVGGIEEKEFCTNIGCYKHNDEYVWGDYSDDTNYILVKDITQKDKCGYIPDVPKTSLNVQTMIYIAVAIMSVFGIFFIVRYNNKSKNI